MVAAHYDYDWPTAEREYMKAFELNPSYASAHQYYALGLMAHGRFAEAEAQLATARRLDPLALIVDVDLAVLRKYQRNFDGVIEVSKSILQRDPTYHLGYSMLTTGYYCERRWDEWRAADAQHPQGEFLRAMANGRPDEIERAFRHLIDENKAGARRPYDVGHYAMLKGDRARHSTGWKSPTSITTTGCSSSMSTLSMIPSAPIRASKRLCTDSVSASI